jgi:RNA polymerase sigma factor (TIGR02999 family)
VSEAPKFEITTMLSRWGNSPQAREDAVRLLYGELRQLAGRIFSGSNAATLQPTALINEAMLKLLGDSVASFDDRAHFFGAAARAMRQVLVDHARRKQSGKRGDGVAPLSLEVALDIAVPPPDDLIALDAVLNELEALDPGAARIVELRYFAGLTLAETAEALDVHPSTVSAEWVHARAWLRRALSDRP